MDRSRTTAHPLTVRDSNQFRPISRADYHFKVDSEFARRMTFCGTNHGFCCLNSRWQSASISLADRYTSVMLVLTSVLMSNRQRQLSEVAILHAIGSRHASQTRALSIEYC